MLTDKELRMLQAQHPTENDPMPFARAVIAAYEAKLREDSKRLTDGERIAAVGGVIKENLTVEFGSVMAVSAMLIKHEIECAMLIKYEIECAKRGAGD